MKKENERRIVAEKQVAENDKIMQCKLNISVANDLIDLVQANIGAN